MPMLFDKMDNALTGSMYHTASKLYQDKKDGRSFWLSLQLHNGSESNWEQEAQHHTSTLQQVKWKGNTNLTLAAHVKNHQSAYTDLLEAASYSTYPSPSKCQQVIYLMESIQCNDPGINARKADVAADRTVNGMRENFELAASHLVEACHVQKKI